MAREYPTGILVNTATGRWHPISFRYSPPFSGDLSGNVGRFKSVGHHTEGFTTQDEAVAFIQGQPAMDLMVDTFEWDGVDIPAMVVWIRHRDGDNPPKVMLC